MNIRTHIKSRHGSRRAEFGPAGEKSSEEHSQSYVTSERRSQQAKAPRPEGLPIFEPLTLLLVGQRPPRVSSLLAPRQRLKK